MKDLNIIIRRATDKEHKSSQFSEKHVHSYVLHMPALGEKMQVVGATSLIDIIRRASEIEKEL